LSSLYTNKLYLIDPVLEPSTVQRLKSLSDKAEFLMVKSETLAHSSFHRERTRSVAFAHVDGMHTFSALTSDLRLCEDILADFGMLCADDFHTDLYPQLPAALYRYLYSGHSDLSIFLVGFNKVYLCRNEAKRYFFNWVRDNLIDGLLELGYRTTLVKTDRHDLFDAFAVVPFTGDKHFGDPSR
jgi:hypothetical protein